jgi:hypothetical protein
MSYSDGMSEKLGKESIAIEHSFTDDENRIRERIDHAQAFVDHARERMLKMDPQQVGTLRTRIAQLAEAVRLARSTRIENDIQVTKKREPLTSEQEKYERYWSERVAELVAQLAKELQRITPDSESR